MELCTEHCVRTPRGLLPYLGVGEGLLKEMTGLSLNHYDSK